MDNLNDLLPQDVWLELYGPGLDYSDARLRARLRDAGTLMSHEMEATMRPMEEPDRGAPSPHEAQQEVNAGIRERAGRKAKDAGAADGVVRNIPYTIASAEGLRRMVDTSGGNKRVRDAVRDGLIDAVKDIFA